MRAAARNKTAWKMAWIKSSARANSKGRNWSPTGSQALGILKVVELNGQWHQHLFPEQAKT